MAKTKNGNGDLSFERKLWQTADKLRNNMDAAEYKHVVLGLIFLKYISDAFAELYNRLSRTKGADPEDADEYKAENISMSPKKLAGIIFRKMPNNPPLESSSMMLWMRSKKAIPRSKVFFQKTMDVRPWINSVWASSSILSAPSA